MKACCGSSRRGLKIGCVVLALQFPLWAKCCVGAETEYVREILFETRAHEEPLNLPIGLGFPSPWGKPSNLIEGHTSLLIFEVDNEGEVVYVDPSDGTVAIFNISENRYRRFSPVVEDFIWPRTFCVGPNDEIYITMSREMKDPDEHKSKLVRYIRNGAEYLLDNNFKIGIADWPMHVASISMDSTIYIDTYDSVSSFSHMYGVVDYYGQFIRRSKALAKIGSNTEVYVNPGRSGQAGTVEGVDVNTNASIFDFHLDLRFHRFLINTPDSSFALLQFKYRNTAYKEDLKLQNFKPVVYIYDYKSGTITKILTEECGRDDFKYFNVSGVCASPKGDIYALVVYYNAPGEITGDEKIVLYRWRKK